MTDLCQHGLPAWSCSALSTDPLRAPGTDDEPRRTTVVEPLPRWAVYLPLVASVLAAAAAVAWRFLR